MFEIIYIPDIVIRSSFFQGFDHYSDLGLITMQKLQKQHNCIPDEHYVQTLLSVSSIWFCFYPLLSSDLCLIVFFFFFSMSTSQMSELEGELERRTVTYTVWNQSATKMENKGWHPKTFSYANASPRKIKEIKVIISFLLLI